MQTEEFMNADHIAVLMFFYENPGTPFQELASTVKTKYAISAVGIAQTLVSMQYLELPKNTQAMALLGHTYPRKNNELVYVLTQKGIAFIENELEKRAAKERAEQADRRARNTFRLAVAGFILSLVSLGWQGCTQWQPVSPPAKASSQSLSGHPASSQQETVSGTATSR